MRRRVGAIEPCLPSRAKRPPTGPDWIHEIKHDGFRLMARRVRRLSDDKCIGSYDMMSDAKGQIMEIVNEERPSWPDDIGLRESTIRRSPAWARCA